MSNYLRLGEWNVICDVCGTKFKIGQVRKRWDGLIVCDKDFEQDHPQKYLRVKESGLSVPIIRQEPEDTFLFSCDILGVQPWAEYAVAGCATVGGTFTFGDICLMGPTALPNFNFADCMVAEAL